MATVVQPAVATDDPDALAAFSAALRDLTRAVRRAQGLASQAGGEAVTLAQYYLVDALAETDEMRVGDLAAVAAVTVPTATRMLDTLERAGTVARRRAPDDRRVVTVTLTDRGRALVAAKRAWVLERQREVFTSLTESERAHAAPLLGHIAAVIGAM